MVSPPAPVPERDEDRLLLAALDHAWKWVDFRLGHRIQAVNYYLIVVAFLAAAYVTTFTAHLRFVSAVLAIIGFGGTVVRPTGASHGPDKITYGSRCLAFRNRRSAGLNGRTSGPAGELNCSACLHGWRSVSRENWVDDARPRKNGPPPCILQQPSLASRKAGPSGILQVC